MLSVTQDVEALSGILACISIQRSVFRTNQKLNYVSNGSVLHDIYKK